MTERVSLNLLELVTEEMDKVLEFKPSWVAVATISEYEEWIIFIIIIITATTERVFDKSDWKIIV